MPSLNRVQLIGHVGRDPEIRFLQSGDKVANFSLATSEKWKGKSGETQERTEWHRVEVFGRAADVVESYVSKGAPIYVEGSIRYEEWTDKDGNKRNTTKVRVGQWDGKVLLLGSKNDTKKRSGRAQADGDDGEDQIHKTVTDENGDDVPF